MRFSNKTFMRLSLISITAIIISFNFLDRPIEYFMYYHLQNTAFHSFGSIVGTYTTSNILCVIALIFCFIAGYFSLKGRKSRAKPYALVGFSFFTSYFIALALKFIFARYRPDLLIHMNLYGFHFLSMKDAFNSFPSGHTIASAAIAFSLCCLTKNRLLQTLLIAYASMVGMCRLFAGAHYLSDVLTSYYIAMMVVMYFNNLIMTNTIFKKRITVSPSIIES